MDSPVSPIIANMVNADGAFRANSLDYFSPSMLVCYVDDVYALMATEYIKSFSQSVFSLTLWLIGKCPNLFK